ncbi:hypothetical protein H920_08349 [Fukomys damarensis]|uniref:Uncharacterized protein n=1 Tax=Fukomys damarensis TaxID=885580 RepID=A0A091E583_FUKDA|nr:hypothetical protein H920_08349 [Fukomys damarensis]
MGHPGAIADLQDLTEPPHPFVVLNLADDLDVLPLIGSLENEGHEHYVCVLLHPELQVLDVLLGHSGIRKVHILLAAQGATIFYLRHREIGTFVLYWQGNEAIIHVDLTAYVHHLTNVIGVQLQHSLIALLHVGIGQCDFECGFLLELHLSSATALDEPGLDLRSLGVKEHSH